MYFSEVIPYNIQVNSMERCKSHNLPSQIYLEKETYLPQFTAILLCATEIFPRNPIARLI